MWTVLRDQPVQFLDVMHIDDALMTGSIRNTLASVDTVPGRAWLDRSREGKSQRLLIACMTREESADRAVPSSKAAASWIEVRTVKPEGKKEMGVRDWWNGWPMEERKRGWIQLGDHVK